MAETTKTNIGLQFFKGVYGKDNALAKSSTVQGAIVFDETTKNIYVDGKIYGGASDVDFKDGILTLTYTDGRATQVLDFNDTASASATYHVFERIDNLIGENVSLANSDGKLNYEGTNYLTEQTTLVGADRALDAQMGVLTDGKEYTGEQYEQLSDEAKQALNDNAIDEAKDTLGGAIHKVDNKVDAVVDEIIKNEKVITDTFSQVQETVGMDENFTIDFNEAKGADLKAAKTVKAGILAVEKELTDIVEDLDAENIQTTTITAAGTGDYTDGITLNFKGVTEEDGKIKQGTRTETQKFAKVATTGKSEDVYYDDTTSKMGTTENPINNVQKAIEILDSRLDDVETIDTFDTVVSTDAASTPAGVKWKSGGAEITGTLPASAATMHKIYLVPDTNETAEHTGVYNEYISVRTGKGESATYAWELIGSTKADLTGYVKTITIGTKQYAVNEGTTNVSITAAGVTVTEGAEGVDTTMAATSTDGLMLGADVTNLASFANKRIAEEIAKLDATVTNDQAETQTETVKVTVTETDGKLTAVSTNVLGAGVEYTGATETAEANLAATKTAGAVLGSDIANIKSYIDAKAAKGTTTITNSLEDNDAIVVTESVDKTDGHTNFDVKLVWSEWGETTTTPTTPETGDGE